jgi:nucleotide-binding universal stress UspA family protein
MLPVRTILHPTDFSEHSNHAFRLACALARDYRAKVIVLHVMTPAVVAFTEGVIPPDIDNLRERSREELYRVQPRDSRVPIEYRLVEGDPGPDISRVASETNADVIVLGTHGRSGLGRLLMGSVAENVIRHAPCPVVTVKTPVPHKTLAAGSAPKDVSEPAKVGNA